MARARCGVRAGRGRPRLSLSRAFTVGHGTLPSEDFITLLRGAGIDAIGDVRTVPRSRHNPQYDISALREWLPAAGIAYAHYKALGGWRRPRPDSPNVALRNAAFRGYADYMLTPEFAQAVDVLLPELASKPTALMCSESVWWRCHRRLLADYLILARGWEVFDLMHDGRIDAHRLTPSVRPTGTGVCYDTSGDGQASLPLVRE